MQPSDSNIEYNSPFDYLSVKYSEFAVIFAILVVAMGIAVLLRIYIGNILFCIPIGLTASLCLAYIYGTLALFAYQRGGTVFPQIVRLFLLAFFCSLCFLIATVHMALGILTFILLVLLFLILQEKYKRIVANHYSSKVLLCDAIILEQSSARRAIQNLVEEVILGPGYQFQIVNAALNDITLAMTLGQTEIDKGNQEAAFLEMQRQVILISEKLNDIDCESSLNRLQTLALVEKLNYEIQQLQQAASLSSFIIASQKHQLLLEIAQCRFVIEKYMHAWRKFHNGYNPMNETGFEDE